MLFKFELGPGGDKLKCPKKNGFKQVGRRKRVVDTNGLTSWVG